MNGNGNRRKNSEISQNRISKEDEERKRRKKKTHLACQRGPVAMRQPTYALGARAALNVLLGNHWNFTADRII